MVLICHINAISLSLFKEKSFIIAQGLKWMGKYRCSRQTLPSLASCALSNGHECAKGAATLHHGFPNATHQLLTQHSNPETGEGVKQRPSHHAHVHQSPSSAGRSGWLGLPVRDPRLLTSHLQSLSSSSHAESLICHLYHGKKMRAPMARSSKTAEGRCRRVL